MTRPTPQPGPGENTAIYAQMGLIALAWGGAFLLIKVAVETIPPFLLSAGRGLLAAAVLGIGIRLRKSGRVRKRAPWAPGVVMGTLHGWLPNVLTAWALTRVDSSLAAILGATSPIFVAVLAHWVLTHERLDRVQALGVVIGLVGVALIIGVDTGLLGERDVPGQLAMVGVAISYAAGNVYGRRVSPTEPARVALRMQIVSGAAALVLAIAFESPWDVRPDGVAVVSLVALAVFSSAIPFWMLVRLFSRARAVVLSTIGYLIPLVALVLGVAVLDERLGRAELAGGALVLVGVFFTGRGRPPPQAGPSLAGQDVAGSPAK